MGPLIRRSFRHWDEEGRSMYGIAEGGLARRLKKKKTYDPRVVGSLKDSSLA